MLDTGLHIGVSMHAQSTQISTVLCAAVAVLYLPTLLLLLQLLHTGATTVALAVCASAWRQA
jgi:hypothetical protein